MTNFEILEKNARRAKEAYSFFEYKSGTATAEYKDYCERAEKVAEIAINRLKSNGAPADRTEKVSYLLEKYKVKKYEWMSDLYINTASVPSVMIAGGANFPTARKEKQNARERSLYANNPDYILRKIESMGESAHVIRSDDPKAIERIKLKIEMLKTSPDPFGNSSAEIRRLKERLLQLAPDDETFKDIQENISVNGAKTYEEIVALWNAGKISNSVYSPESNEYYFYLPLDFYNGKRHYKELLNFQIDEAGENRIEYDIEKRSRVNKPLTDEYKYNLIIGKMRGSGNKKVMYNHLRGLSPEAQKAQEIVKARAESGENETVLINGEKAEVIKNADDMRLQLIFGGKPSEETRNILKSNGFRWAPSAGAWQRLLNGNSIYALKNIIDKE